MIESRYMLMPHKRDEHDATLRPASRAPPSKCELQAVPSSCKSSFSTFVLVGPGLALTIVLQVLKRTSQTCQTNMEALGCRAWLVPMAERVQTQSFMSQRAASPADVQSSEGTTTKHLAGPAQMG